MNLSGKCINLEGIKLNKIIMSERQILHFCFLYVVPSYEFLGKCV